MRRMKSRVVRVKVWYEYAPGLSAAIVKQRLQELVADTLRDADDSGADGVRIYECEVDGEPHPLEPKRRRLVEGGVRDVLATHPEYFTQRGREMIVDGASKRVIGTIRSFAAQAAEGRDTGNRGDKGSLHPG